MFYVLLGSLIGFVIGVIAVIERHEQKERIDQHIEKLKEKNEILIKERDEIQNTYRALKQYLRDCYNGAKSWLDQTEERFQNEPPF